MAEGFYFNNISETLVFWRAVRMFKIEGMECRTNLLRKLVARKKAKYIPHPEEFLKGKKIKAYKHDGNKEIKGL